VLRDEMTRLHIIWRCVVLLLCYSDWLIDPLLHSCLLRFFLAIDFLSFVHVPSIGLFG
jgi:hypothetical protein